MIEQGTSREDVALVLVFWSTANLAEEPVAAISSEEAYLSDLDIQQILPFRLVSEQGTLSRELNIELPYESVDWDSCNFASLCWIRNGSAWKNLEPTSLFQVFVLKEDLTRNLISISLRNYKAPTYPVLREDTKITTSQYPDTTNESHYVHFSANKYRAVVLGDNAAGFMQYCPIQFVVQAELDYTPAPAYNAIYTSPLVAYLGEAPQETANVEEIAFLRKGRWYTEENVSIDTPTLESYYDNSVNFSFVSPEISATGWFEFERNEDSSIKQVYIRDWVPSEFSGKATVAKWDYLTIDTAVLGEQQHEWQISSELSRDNTFSITNYEYTDTPETRDVGYDYVAARAIVEPENTENSLLWQSSGAREATFSKTSALAARGITTLNMNTLEQFIMWLYRNTNEYIDADTLRRVSQEIDRKGRFLPNYVFTDQVFTDELLNQAISVLPVQMYYSAKGLSFYYTGSASEYDVLEEFTIDNAWVWSESLEILPATASSLDVKYRYSLKENALQLRKEFTTVSAAGKNQVFSNRDISSLNAESAEWPFIADSLTCEFVGSEWLLAHGQNKVRASIRLMDTSMIYLSLGDVIRVSNLSDKADLYRIVGKRDDVDSIVLDILSA